MARFRLREKVIVRENLEEWEGYDDCTFVPEMSKYKGRICTISEVIGGSSEYRNRYHLEEDPDRWYFSNSMLRRVEEEDTFINLEWHV